MVSANVFIAIAAGSILCTQGVDAFATVVPALSSVPVHASTTQLRKTSMVRKPAYTPVRVQASSNAIKDQQGAGEAETDFVVETAALSASVPEEHAATSPLVGGLLLFAVSSFAYLLKTLKSQMFYSSSDEEAVPLKSNQPYTFAALAVDGTTAVPPPQPQFEIATQFQQKKSSSQTKFAQTPAVAAPEVAAPSVTAPTTKGTTTRKPADAKKAAVKKTPASAPAKQTAAAPAKKVANPKAAPVQKSATTSPALAKKAAASKKEVKKNTTPASTKSSPPKAETKTTKKTAAPAAAEKNQKVARPCKEITKLSQMNRLTHNKKIDRKSVV